MKSSPQKRIAQSMAGRGGMTGIAGMGTMTKTGGMTLTSTGLKTKDKKGITEGVRKDRERRRRKMIVD